MEVNLNCSYILNRRVSSFFFWSLVIHVSLVPKGYANNFTFSGEDNLGEVAKITLPSYLFRNQGNFAGGTNELRFAPADTPYNGLYGEAPPEKGAKL